MEKLNFYPLDQVDSSSKQFKHSNTHLVCLHNEELAFLIAKNKRHTWLILESEQLNSQIDEIIIHFPKANKTFHKKGKFQLLSNRDGFRYQDGKVSFLVWNGYRTHSKSLLKSLLNDGAFSIFYKDKNMDEHKLLINIDDNRIENTLKSIDYYTELS